MNEDYLWDKSGGDDEIEKLENALKAFRYQETAPPALPAKNFTVEEKPLRKFFSLRFSFTLAAGAAVVLILFAAWLQLAGSSMPAIDESAKSVEKTPIDDKIQKDEIVNPPQPFPANDFQTPQPAPGGTVAKIRREVPAKPGLLKTAARKQRTKNQQLVLTAEEKYAYDQLMLALSITGSKLKIVKDKIENIEAQNARLTDEK